MLCEKFNDLQMIENLYLIENSSKTHQMLKMRNCFKACVSKNLGWGMFTMLHHEICYVKNVKNTHLKMIFFAYFRDL